MSQSRPETEPEPRFLARFLLANASYFAIFFSMLIIEVISSGDVKFLMSLEFYSKILSYPLLWFSYIFWIFIITGKALYRAVVKDRND